MENLGFIGKIANLFGKEISEDLAKEFQSELDEFKELIKANRGLGEIPNLEIETHSFNVPNQSVIDLDFKTKIEHKRLLGIFITKTSSAESEIALSLNRKPIVADGYFPTALISKHYTLSVEETAWRLDFPIATTDFNVKFKDLAPAYAPYDVRVHLICEK